jgi:hypothetical protein
MIADFGLGNADSTEKKKFLGRDEENCLTREPLISGTFGSSNFRHSL